MKLKQQIDIGIFYVWLDFQKITPVKKQNGGHLKFLHLSSGGSIHISDNML